MTAEKTVRVWAVPSVIAALSIAALVIALVDDGVWDIVAALTLATTLVFATYRGLTRRG